MPEPGRRLEDIRAWLPLGPALGTAGQPAAHQFTAIAGSGYEVVVNLALPTSDRAVPNEGEIVAGLGLAYVHLPVDFEHPQPTDVTAFRRVMRAFDGRRVFVHCAANMRVSAFVFLHRVLDLGVPRTEAEADLHRIWHPTGAWAELIELTLREG
ncbi:MAG: protein tyrosine phosphatase family protein [Limisphaerales bacterium]